MCGNSVDSAGRIIADYFLSLVFNELSHRKDGKDYVVFKTCFISQEHGYAA